MRAPAPLLVLGSVVSVQVGGALAATLVPQIGASGSALLRLFVAAALMSLVVRPRARGYTRSDWAAALALGVALGCMNWSFYGSLAHLPIGVAVTVEFTGPLLLATALSRRWFDLIAVLFAAVGVLLISQALTVPWSQLSWPGLLLAATAGLCWAAYILASQRVGRIFPRVDGLVFAMVVATLVVVPAGVPSVPDWTGSDVLKGAGVALLSSVLPYSLEMLALRRLAPAVFGILLSLEPAVAALSGLVILGQRLVPLQIAGMGLVVLASVIVMGRGARRRSGARTGEAEELAELG